MAKFFANLGLVLIVGVVLAVLIALFPDSGYRPPTGDLLNGVLQWLHVFFGITWIGLLYYFNFVQTPVMPTVPAELKPGVSKYIAPKALFYFRWGAAFTVLTGLLLAWSYGELVEALTLQEPARLIGIGMWLALIMAFNVWVIIWPNQKKVLGFVAADDAAKAKAAATAGMASRLNVLLSIPMLLAHVVAGQLLGRQRPFRVELAGASEVGVSAADIAELLLADGPHIVGQRRPDRLRANRAVEIADRLLKPVLAEPQKPHVEERFGLAGVHSNGRSEIVIRTVEVTQAHLDDAAVDDGGNAVIVSQQFVLERPVALTDREFARDRAE